MPTLNLRTGMLGERDWVNGRVRESGSIAQFLTSRQLLNITTKTLNWKWRKLSWWSGKSFEVIIVDSSYFRNYNLQYIMFKLDRVTWSYIYTCNCCHAYYTAASLYFTIIFSEHFHKFMKLCHGFILRWSVDPPRIRYVVLSAFKLSLRQYSLLPHTDHMTRQFTLSYNLVRYSVIRSPQSSDH
jgi:hypothetical protein